MKNNPPLKNDLFGLIEEITPFNNLYRDLVKNGASGTQVLEAMWVIGDKLDRFMQRNMIKPHNLYWQIYGKAEGLKTSYITRDFLSYCLRVRRYFKKSDDVSKKFPNLQRYSLFREAFPLLGNPKYKLSDDQESTLIRLLNSNKSPQEIKEVIQKLKSSKIGITNTRTQRLDEIKPLADNFVTVYNHLYSLIKVNDVSELNKFTTLFGKEFLKVLSGTVSALTQENLYVPEIEISNQSALPREWQKFINDLKYLLSSALEVRNRFRRIVPPRKIFELADMLNVLTINDGVDNYRKRKNIN